MGRLLDLLDYFRANPDIAERIIENKWKQAMANLELSDRELATTDYDFRPDDLEAKVQGTSMLDKTRTWVSEGKRLATEKIAQLKETIKTAEDELRETELVLRGFCAQEQIFTEATRVHRKRLPKAPEAKETADSADEAIQRILDEKIKETGHDLDS